MGDIVVFWMVRWYSGTVDESGWHGGIVDGMMDDGIVVGDGELMGKSKVML